MSIFLENRQGRLDELARLLASHGINMSAWCIAESTEFGILRAIVSDPDRALQILRDNHFAAGINEVLGISVPNRPGALAKVLTLLNQHNIFIEYMYAFAGRERANAIICPSDLDRCQDVLKVFKEKEIEILADSYLYSL